VFIPGYRVSRAYVNNVNITNTSVNIVRVTNVYNTIVINRNVNNITYVNRQVNGGVTVVSHDTFVNARPVARNAVSVPPRELAAAPVSHTVAAEPVRGSVLGSGRPVASRPPLVVTSRPVVALRTPAPMPNSFDQREAQAGGHLNQPSLVRQEAPGRPVPSKPAAQSQSDGFHSFGTPNSGNSQPKQPPRVWEAQGTPEPEKSTQAQPEGRSPRSSVGSRPSQQAQQPTQQWSHPLAKPVAPVQERNEQQQREEEQKFSTWQQQKPSPAPAPKPAQHSSPPPKQAAPSKKGH
jgi:hypothetical protein